MSLPRRPRLSVAKIISSIGKSPELRKPKRAISPGARKIYFGPSRANYNTKWIQRRTRARSAMMRTSPHTHAHTHARNIAPRRVRVCAASSSHSNPMMFWRSRRAWRPRPRPRSPPRDHPHHHLSLSLYPRPTSARSPASTPRERAHHRLVRSPGIDKLARLFVRVGDAHGDVHHGRTEGGDAGEERPRLRDFPGERGEETLVRVRHRVLASRSAEQSAFRDALRAPTTGDDERGGVIDRRRRRRRRRQSRARCRTARTATHRRTTTW